MNRTPTIQYLARSYTSGSPSRLWLTRNTHIKRNHDFLILSSKHCDVELLPAEAVGVIRDRHICKDYPSSSINYKGVRLFRLMFLD
jgi:hypothetical protein